MADAATVDVEEDGLVTIDVEDAALPPDPAEVVVEPKPTPKPAPRTRQAVTNAADEAAAALTQAVKTATAEADNLRRAAEATALAERQKAEAAQRLAEQRAQEAQGYKQQAETHELTLLNSGIEKATGEIASAQTELERAMEAGEFAKATAAQVKLAKASAALDRLEASKADYEAGARRTPTTEGRVEAPPVVTDQFEQYLGQMAPRAQSWLRAHRECAPSTLGGDETKNAAMMEGHYAALKQRIPQGTDEYFRVIEEHVGYRQHVVTTTQQTTPQGGPVSQAADIIEAGTEPPQPKPRQQQRQVQPSAPVTREPPTASGQQQQRSVRLTPEQQEIALLATQPRDIQTADGRVVRESDIDYRKRAFGQYARELIAAQAEGKIGNRYDRL
jgi:hypothetical protein